MLMRSLLFGVLLTIVLAVSGCATLTRQDFKSVTPPISVAWQKTPDLRAPTWASVILTTFGGIVTAPIGAIVEGQSTKELKEKIVIPDIGFEVASRYMSIWREKGTAPEMVLLQFPIENDHKFPGASIDFKFKHYFIGADGGLLAHCKITMKDNSGRTIHGSWKMFVSQEGKRLSRDKFMDDNGKLLVEEIKVASQYLANEFVKEILSELSK